MLTACSDRSKPPSAYEDVVEIDYPSAIFYKPDSVQIKNIRDVTDSGVFESIMHECFYQMRNARLVIEKYYPDVKIVETTKARYLLFKTKGTGERIDLNEKNDPCGLFLYDGRQPARLVDMTNIDSELKFYFSQ
jgi:hypothetical protein